MKISYSRPLNDDEAVENFLYKQLRYREDRNIIPMIVKGEIALPVYEDFPTSTSKKFRVSEFREEDNRWEMRRQVVNELYDYKREGDDESICLGRGGAAPLSEIKRNGDAVILIGLPASGKSSIANTIAESYGAYILDSDFAKRKLPEFKNYEWGASLVHSESDEIIFGYEHQPDDFESLLQKVSTDKTNIVIPKIGQKPENIKILALVLQKLGYNVHLISVNLRREIATLRAVERYRATKRYVPLGLIFDGYSNDPILTYYILKSKENQLFASFGELSTEQRPPTVTDLERDSSVKLFQNPI